MIHLRNIVFSYGRQALFEDLSIDFTPGGIYGLLGKNGAGKTTLFKLICGLLKPDQGHCETNGFASQKRHPDMLGDLFLIPESFYLPPLTISKYTRLHAPFYRKFDYSLYRGYLNEMELDESSRIDTLSYGLKKRFLLSFGLSTQCAVILLDEPTNGLDIPSKRVFRQLLLSAVEKERTFILATHQIKEVENVFDHLVFVDDGRILLENSLVRLAESLSFKTTQDRDSAGSALYFEEVPGGYSAIYPNETGEEGVVDIEFLFNALMLSPDGIIQHLRD